MPSYPVDPTGRRDMDLQSSLFPSLWGPSWSLSGYRGRNVMHVSSHLFLLNPCRLRSASLKVSPSFITSAYEPTISKHNPGESFSCLYLLKCLLHIFDQLVTAVFVIFWRLCFIICSPVVSIVSIICKAWMHHMRTPDVALLWSAGEVQLPADPMQTCSFSPKQSSKVQDSLGFVERKKLP